MKFPVNHKKIISGKQKSTWIQLFLMGGVVLFIYSITWIMQPSSLPFYEKFITMFSPNKKLTDYTAVGFNVLSDYNYVPTTNPDAHSSNNDSIPANIKSLNGKKVAVTGFVVPLTRENGGVTSFMLVRSHMLCCWGNIPQMNEWISVEMNGSKFATVQKMCDGPDKQLPTVVYGTMEVGEKYDSGYLLSIYRMKADEMLVSKNQ